MKAIELRTEFLLNPLGIDRKNPMLNWICEGGIKQTAYQIVARNESYEILWDTGKILSSTMRLKYTGTPLNSRDRIRWQVQLWDENDIPGNNSDEAFFEMGLLQCDDWIANWITGAYKPRKKRRYPVDCFYKEFDAKDVAKARLYTTACGVYEGRLNGSRIGDFILAPGITDYRKRIQYQTYDVTSLVQEGINKLEYELADGWYRGSVGAWGLRNQYGKQTKLLIQLELAMLDGSTSVITSDRDWMWCNDGPIRIADNKDGEVVDANMSPQYIRNAKLAKCRVLPTASNNISIKEHEVFKPHVLTTPGGKTVLDFGQNIAGYISFSVNATQGQNIVLLFGEMLDDVGEFSQKNIQCTGNPLVGKDKITPLQRVDYCCKDGENSYKSKFCIFGFRYVLIETNVVFNPEDFSAIAVYSDMKETVSFDCSNDLLKKYLDCTIWSAKGNSCDIPTDCPTRERHGWAGDAQIFSGTAGYIFEYLPFAKKYLRDLYDWQRRNGKLPQIAPVGGRDFYMAPLDGSVGWSDAGIIIPYRMWKLYGDEQILIDNYDSMRRYAQFMQKRCGKRQLLSYPLKLRGSDKKYAVNKGQAYGEWTEPADVHPTTWKDIIFAHPEESTAYTCVVMEMMNEMALALGETENAMEFARYADGTRNAYNALMRTEKYSLDTDRQARLVRPLFFGLLDDEQKSYAEDRLLKALDNYRWRVGTGFLSTPLILFVLADINIEAAYRLLENEEMPGWLFMPKNGATTVWESWEGTKAKGGISSLNHYAKGAVFEWVFRSMCGIHVSGENHFEIAPKPGGSFKYAKLKYRSIYGEVSCGWERFSGKVVIDVIIPSNCCATVFLPDGHNFEVTSGNYRYECQ